jgi:hypothetical protein
MAIARHVPPVCRCASIHASGEFQAMSTPDERHLGIVDDGADEDGVHAAHGSLTTFFQLQLSGLSERLSPAELN